MTYSRIDKRPGYRTLLGTLLLTIPTRRDFFSFYLHKAIIRQWRASRFPIDLSFPEPHPPTIELLIVVAGKDIDLLPVVLVSAIVKTKNPIAEITLIIPNEDKLKTEKVINRIGLTTPTTILLEDDVIDQATRANLKVKFKSRYGWVLQQLLAVEFILNSSSKGVLLLDADTILTRDVTWLDNHDNQKLMVTLDYHAAYYKVLNQILGTPVNPKTIHVSHHMLIQPKYMKEIFKKFKLIDTKELTKLLIEFSDSKDGSPLCVDFELYAQGMLTLYPDRLELRKFGNTSVERSEFTTLENLYTKYSRYNSVSMHSYLEAEFIS